MTATLKRQHTVLAVLSILLNVGPIAAYTIVAMAKGGAVHQKAALAATILIAVIMTAISWVNKVAMRSKVLVILVGLYLVLDRIVDVLFVLACCQVLDEMIVTPIKARIKTRLTINREIDRRG